VTHYFLDSSAVVKRYVDETGSWWIRGLFTGSLGHTLLIAQITPVEAYSGVLRRAREGTVDISVAQGLRRSFSIQIKRQYSLIALTQQVINQAQDLLEKYPLRAYDAVQLASANTANERLVMSNVPPLIFVSADERLTQAANTEGLTVEDPNLHG